MARVRALLACLIAFVVVSALSAGIAHAEPDRKGPPPDVVGAADEIVNVSLTPPTRPGEVSVQAIIFCTVRPQNPHDSSHVGGNVNVVLSTTCDIPVPRITTVECLYQYSYQKTCGIRTTYGSRYGSANAAMLCVPAYYQGKGYVTIYAPPGYTPAVQTVEAASAHTWVDCK